MQMPLVLMNLRFDGQFGFFGGIVEQVYHFFYLFLKVLRFDGTFGGFGGIVELIYYFFFIIVFRNLRFDAIWGGLWRHCGADLLVLRFRFLLFFAIILIHP